MNNQPLAMRQRCPICNQSGKYSYTGQDLLHGIPGEFIYAECMTCGAIYQVPMPKPDQIASFYPGQYDPYRPGKAKERNFLEKSVLRATYDYHHLDSILPDWIGKQAGMVAYRDSIPFTENGRLLDIGCGGGKFLLSMQQLGWQAEGVEFNKSAVETCRQSGLKVFHGEISGASYLDNSFDVVTARHVIEHIAEPSSFLAEIYRILKPSGIMVLKTPNSHALGRKWFGTNWFPNDVPRHLILYSPVNLRLLAEKHGFCEKNIQTFSTPKCILNSWDYLRGSQQGRPSKKCKWRRMLARFYVIAANSIHRGDEIFAIYEKPAGS